MNTNKKWFSFIEIIVVSTLLIVVTVSWGYYFQDFIKNQEMNIYINSFEEYIKKQDLKIKNKQIYDYQIEVYDWYVSTFSNTSWLDKYLQFTPTDIWWEYYIYWWNSEDIVYYTLYKWVKKIEDWNISWDSIISIEKWNNYTLEAQIENQNINSAEIFIFDDNNQLDVYNIVDNSNNQLNSLLIENYWWNKYYKNWQNNSVLDSPIQVIFDLYGHENTLIMK